MATPASSLIPVLIALTAGLTIGGAVGLALQDRASAEWKQRWHQDTASLTERAQLAERGQAVERETARTAVAEAARLKAVVVEQAREIETLRVSVEPRYADAENDSFGDTDIDLAPPMPISIR